MKETGLMFKAPLVRSMLGGQKLVTRRIAGTTTTMGHDSILEPHRGRKSAFTFLLPEQVDLALQLSPFGQAGDLIYVRETCNAVELPSGLDGVRYHADKAFSPIEPTHEMADAWCKLNAYRGQRGATIPAVHMPKWAARIWLQIERVRLEPLHAITDSDCWREGAISAASPDEFSVHSVLGIDGKSYLSPRGAFSGLWESTGASWNANPWVWVYDFHRIKRGLGADGAEK